MFLYFELDENGEQVSGQLHRDGQALGLDADTAYLAAAHSDSGHA